MRFLVRELAYETPVAAGRFHYYRRDEPTGAVETWRLTEALDGYRILRVDLDARAAESGDSYLYHLLSNSAGAPERLMFRFFRPGYRVQGNVLFEREQVTLSREVNGERREEAWTPAEHFCFWFPAAAGLGALAGCLSAEEQPGLTLDKEMDFGLLATTVRREEAAPEQIIVQGQPCAARPLTLRWAGQTRMVWLNEQGWPVQAQRDELLIRQTHHVRFGGKPCDELPDRQNRRADGKGRPGRPNRSWCTVTRRTHENDRTE